jgi:hypothetical protein
MFLGRSKAEQYFGFLPFFTYINFVLGYVPLVLSDVTSQIIVLLYVMYNSMYKLLNTLAGKFTNTTLMSIEGSYSVSTSTSSTPLNTELNSSPLFSNSSSTKQSDLKTNPFFSKSLSLARQNLLYTGNSYMHIGSGNTLCTVSNDVNFSTLRLKIPHSLHKNSFNGTLTMRESYYLNTVSEENWKVRNLTVSLSDISNLYKTNNASPLFNFNLTPNLNNAKQQRWFTRNSLLNESFITNSFLVTQAKKLIGLGTLDREFSSKNL